MKLGLAKGTHPCYYHLQSIQYQGIWPELNGVWSSILATLEVQVSGLRCSVAYLFALLASGPCYITIRSPSSICLFPGSLNSRVAEDTSPETHEVPREYRPWKVRCEGMGSVYILPNNHGTQRGPS